MLGKYRELIDEELVLLAQSGDSLAEECLIKRYTNSIRERKHIYFIAGADSEDVIQEGMIGLFKAIQSYCADKDASFKTYANLCINRQIISAIRAAARRKHEPLNNSISLDGERDDESLFSGYTDTADDLLIEKKLAEIIWSDENSLLSRMEKTVLKEYIKGKSYGEIANKLGKNTKSIDNAMQRIRKKIVTYIVN